MAEHLASIFGTEKDRVNCPFYFKIGACRHGDRCSRIHNKPTISQTLLLQNMYQNPATSMPPGPDGLPPQVDPRQSQEHFEDFYEDIFEELDKFGQVENLNVCDNIADHMVGSVYVKFVDENAAAMALQGLQGRFYMGRPILVEFSPVTDFREATCRQYEENTCTRGGYCNFMHLRPISRDLRKQLFGRYKGSLGGVSRSDEPRGPNDRGPTRGGFGGRGGFGRGGGRGGYGGRGGGYDDRGRDRDRGPPGGRESSAERKAKIASWNKARMDSGDGPPPPGGGYPGPPPQQGFPPPQHYGQAPPQGYAQYGQQPPGYGSAPPSHGGYR